MTKTILLALSFVILLVYLTANIYSSLSISPLLAPFSRGEFDGVVGFLRSIRTLPEFDKEYAKFKTHFGQRLYTHVYEEDVAEKERVQKFERILAKNPYARDVLYQLYLDYKKEGNMTRANEYLKRAQAVDPTVK